MLACLQGHAIAAGIGASDEGKSRLHLGRATVQEWLFLLLDLELRACLPVPNCVFQLIPDEDDEMLDEDDGNPWQSVWFSCASRYCLGLQC
jgi:hypothetical protein